MNYPSGALFDLLGLIKDPAGFKDLKGKKMKNNHLAMVAWLGFNVQAFVTQKRPIENLLDFIDDPSHQNLLAYISGNH